jgi:hypothetical protein
MTVMTASAEKRRVQGLFAFFMFYLQLLSPEGVEEEELQMGLTKKKKKKKHDDG